MRAVSSGGWSRGVKCRRWCRWSGVWVAAAWWLLFARRCGRAGGRVGRGLPVDAGGPWVANPFESLALGP